jgi:hypothetical protein
MCQGFMSVKNPTLVFVKTPHLHDETKPDRVEPVSHPNFVKTSRIRLQVGELPEGMSRKYQNCSTLRRWPFPCSRAVYLKFVSHATGDGGGRREHLLSTSVRRLCTIEYVLGSDLIVGRDGHRSAKCC